MSKKRRNSGMPPVSPVRKALCTRCKKVLVLVGAGRRTVCNACLDDETTSQSKFCVKHLSRAKQAEVRSALDARLASLAETDSSQWPSPLNDGARHWTTRGADRSPSGSGAGPGHRVRLFAELQQSAKRRGLLGDPVLASDSAEFVRSSSFAALLKVARRLVELAGDAILSERPGLYPPRLSDEGSHRGRSSMGPPRTPSANCPSYGERKKGHAAHIAARHPDKAEAGASTSAPSCTARPRAALPCPLCRKRCDDIDLHLMRDHRYRLYRCPRCAATCWTVPNEDMVCLECRAEFSAVPAQQASLERQSSRRPLRRET